MSKPDPGTYKTITNAQCYSLVYAMGENEFIKTQIFIPEGIELNIIEWVGRIGPVVTNYYGKIASNLQFDGKSVRNMYVMQNTLAMGSVGVGGVGGDMHIGGYVAMSVEGDLRYKIHRAFAGCATFSSPNLVSENMKGQGRWLKNGDEIRIYYTCTMPDGSISACITPDPNTNSEWIKYKDSRGTLNTYLTTEDISKPNDAVIGGEELIMDNPPILADSPGDYLQTDDDSYYNYDPQALTDTVKAVYNSSRTSAEDTINAIVKLKKCFGLPPIFSKAADIRYMQRGRFNGEPSQYTDFGRNWINMFGQSNTILSIQPGKVKYMPGFSEKDRNTFWQMAKDAMGSGNVGDDANLETDMSGQLYEFRSDYTNYINKVNLFARVMSIYLGIGDKICPIGGSGRTYKEANYSFLTQKLDDSQFQGTGMFGGLIADAVNLITAPVRSVQAAGQLIGSSINDDMWMHFYMTADGTGADDSMSVSTRASSLESLFTGNLSGMARDIEFLTGSPMNSQSIENLLTGITDGLFSGMDIQTTLNTIIKGGSDVISGGHLVFPQMIDDCTYDHSFRATMKLIAPHADPESIFLYEYLPICHLLPFVVPEMLSENTYTYPCICKATCKGMFASDLAIVSQLSINRGGSDSSQWNMAGLPTEVEVSFNITPLYSKLMTTTTAHPIMFMQNTALQEYLGAICGVTFTGERLTEKLSILKTLTGNKVFADPMVNMATGFFDSTLANAVRKWWNFP